MSKRHTDDLATATLGWTVAEARVRYWRALADVTSALEWQSECSPSLAKFAQHEVDTAQARVCAASEALAALGAEP